MQDTNYRLIQTKQTDKARFIFNSYFLEQLNAIKEGELDWDAFARWRRKGLLQAVGDDYFTIYGDLTKLHEILFPVNYTKDHWVWLFLSSWGSGRDNPFNGLRCLQALFVVELNWSTCRKPRILYLDSMQDHHARDGDRIMDAIITWVGWEYQRQVQASGPAGAQEPAFVHIQVYVHLVILMPENLM